MRPKFVLTWTAAFALCIAGLIATSSADSFDRASALDGLMSFLEKQEKGKDGQKPLDKDAKAKACKNLCDLLESARKENADEMAKWQADKQNPPKDQTPDRAITKAWGINMQTRLKRIQDAGSLLDGLEMRFEAFCGKDCCKKTDPRTGVGPKPGGSGKPTVVDTVPIEELKSKKK